MLVLSRDKDEDVVIVIPPHLCDEVRVCVRVAEIRSNSVRLAFDAPRCIPIHRREVLDQIEEQGGLDELIEATRRAVLNNVIPGY